MSFREWLKLQELGTGTNAIAVFARPVGDDDNQRKMVRRDWPSVFGDRFMSATSKPKSRKKR